ncbi:MAG: molybdopterin synthase sulfur carrier subunit, partial [Flavobacteriales bacterium]|nr:molybdopterin synthase sulfur carrier subunit [Flavobacteriales bacterium]
HINIPTPLRKFTNDNSKVEFKGETVIEALQSLAESYPALSPYLLDGDRIKPFIKLFKGETDIQSLDREQTKVKEGDVLSIIPAIAGGKNQ